MTKENCQPTNALVNRKTGLEWCAVDTGKARSMYDRKNGQEKVQNASPKYAAIMKEALAFNDRLAKGIEDPLHFDNQTFTKEYVQFVKKVDTERKAYKARKEAGKLSAAEQKTAKNDLWILENAASERLNNFEKNMKTGMVEQLQKNRRYVNKPNISNEIQRLNAEFKKADGTFSRPKDAAYTEFAKALNDFPEKLKQLDISLIEGNAEKMQKINTECLDNLYHKAEAVLKSCENKKTLTDNECKRLKAVNRVMDFIEFNRQAAIQGNPDVMTPYTDQKLAAKLSDAQVATCSKDQMKGTWAVSLCTNRKLRQANIQTLQTSDGFAEMKKDFALTYPKNRKALSSDEALLRENGTEMLKRYEKALEVTKHRSAKETEKQIAQEREYINQEASEKEKAQKAKATKEIALGGGPNSPFDRLCKNAQEGYRMLVTEVKNNQGVENPEMRCANGTAVARALSYNIILAEREALNGPDYLKTATPETLKKGPLEECLNQYGSSAFIKAIDESPVIKGLKGEDGIPYEALKELTKVSNREALAKGIVESKSMTKQITERTKEIKQTSAHKEKAEKTKEVNPKLV